MSDIHQLLKETSADREAGTEDAWWHDRIAYFVLGESYGEHGGQDDADRRRILRLPKVERALSEAILLRDDLAQDRERHAALFVAAMKRMVEARDAWEAFKIATTSDDHFSAVARLDAALAVKDMDQ